MEKAAVMSRSTSEDHETKRSVYFQKLSPSMIKILCACVTKKPPAAHLRRVAFTMCGRLAGALLLLFSLGSVLVPQHFRFGGLVGFALVVFHGHGSPFDGCICGWNIRSFHYNRLDKLRQGNVYLPCRTLCIFAMQNPAPGQKTGKNHPAHASGRCAESMAVL